MEQALIDRLCRLALSKEPLCVQRCAQGIGNYVYRLDFPDGCCALRCSREPDAYQETVLRLQQLAELDVPVPRILWNGRLEGWQCLLLTWLEGRDMGVVYPALTREQKQAIAQEVEAIQRRVAALPVDVPPDWCWRQEVDSLLDRADRRIRENGFFDPEKVNCLRQAAADLAHYFRQVLPVAYLDDISTKNLLIHRSRVSGVIDVDWIGVGDRLTYMALTRMALLDLQYDTDYTDFLLEAFSPNQTQRKAFAFYTLLYSVDFMGERGSIFLDKRVPVSTEIINKLNDIFDALWEDYLKNDTPVASV